MLQCDLDLFLTSGDFITDVCTITNTTDVRIITHTTDVRAFTLYVP
jgi:hypothetical protein